MSIEYRKATSADVFDIVPRLRECDRAEVTLSAGEVQQAMLDSLTLSAETLCVTEGGIPIVLAGVSHVAGLGVPWMVATPEVGKHRKRLLADALPVVQRWLEQYGTLTNFVHAENATSIRWLRWLGFTIGEEVPEYGVGKVPFLHFYKVSSNV